MFNVTRKSFIQYAVLPGFRQRFRDLFASGFQYIPYFIALVYGAVRLLPANHPYLQPANMGRFGIRHVIAEAANNIVLSRRNLDQILLFICILFGMVLATMQVALLATAIFFQPVMAAMPTTFAGFFITANPDQDLAHMMMDMVFGVPDLFNSCIDTATGCLNSEGNSITRPAAGVGTNWAFESAGGLPFPIHRGLHQLFQVYNIGLTVVGVFITLYFMMTVIAETAESGTPFGKRFNKVWAPVRFVVAFGLLFPVGSGYNSAQYIVLYAAKFGSGFATNGWNIFNDTLVNSYGGAVGNLANSATAAPTNLTGYPNIPEVGTLLQFMFTAKTCAEAQRISLGDNPTPEIYPYVVTDPLTTNAVGPQLQINYGTTYDQLLEFTQGETQAIIRFGKLDPQKNATKMGHVAPTCGELTFKLADPRPPACTGTWTANWPTCQPAEPGVQVMQEYYWFIIKELWYETMEGRGPIPGGPYGPYAENLVNKHEQFNEAPTAHDVAAALPQKSWLIALQSFYRNDLREVITGSPDPGTASTGILGFVGGTDALTRMSTSARWTVNNTLRDKGWAGGAIWYNLIAEMNGAISSAVLNIPLPSRYPAVMEKVYAEKRQSEERIDFEERFNPKSNTGPATEGLSATQQKYAYILWHAFNIFQEGGGVTTSHNAPTGNAVIDILNALFGTEGLFSMRRNQNVHPLAQLTGVGRSLIETSIRNLTYASIGGAGGALIASMVSEATGEAAAIISKFLVTFAMLGLTAGFILFYVVPFLPFIYFFFAFGGWVKGIFEAMVGAPLWALAHLRIDGNGLSGQAAVSGYFLIFEVFLRPILIVFGLLASISIFSALVSVMNQVFDLVIANTGGFDVTAELTGAVASEIASMRSAVDEFFFTVIYTIIVYLMGMSSFKLVDLIPNNILRWMGQSVATFGDQREDSGQSLVGTSTIGAQQTLGSVGGGLEKLAGLGSKQSDRRLKENIEHLGYENGIPVYSFSYIGETERYKGVMAQDILHIKPEAVVMGENGYMSVYYDLIGIEMELLTENAGNDNA